LLRDVIHGLEDAPFFVALGREHGDPREAIAEVGYIIEFVRLRAVGHRV